MNGAFDVYFVTNPGLRKDIKSVLGQVIMLLFAGSLFPCTLYLPVHVLMRDEKEERKKQARSNKQGKATQHTQGSHFPKKMSCLGWDSNPRHSTLQTCLCMYMCSLINIYTYIAHLHCTWWHDGSARVYC